MADIPVIGTSLLVAAIGGFMLWFALGTQRNIRKGNQLLKWLQGGLPQLGPRTTVRWLGSSAVQLDVADAHNPFDTAQVVVVLEPRDVGFLWLWARMRSRRDFVILRADLERAPAFEVEAGDPSGWTGGDRLRKLDGVAWERDAWADRNVGLAHTPGADVSGVRDVWERLMHVTGGVWRISVRQQPPHLEIHVMPPDITASSADDLFAAFRALAATASRR